jgi:Fe-S-cluster-containing dehydrogenase component
MKILQAVRMERCIGCHSCSLACARLVHKVLSWDLCGIRIKSSGGMSTGFEAQVCVACDPAPCARACPTGSLTQRKGGGVKQDRSLCIRCGECARACPVDAIHLSAQDNAPYLCIHCGRCVAFCPHSCLALNDTPERRAAVLPEFPAPPAARASEEVAK